MDKSKICSVVFKCFLSGVVSFNIRFVKFVVSLGTELFSFFFYELSNFFYTHFRCLNVVLQCPVTFWRLAQWRISEHKTVNTPQKLMRGRMFNKPLHPPLSQTPVSCCHSLFLLSIRVGRKRQN